MIFVGPRPHGRRNANYRIRLGDKRPAAGPETTIDHYGTLGGARRKALRTLGGTGAPAWIYLDHGGQLILVDIVNLAGVKQEVQR